LLPLKQKAAIRCCRCYKQQEARFDTPVPLTINNILLRCWGWFGLALMGAFIWLIMQQLYPEDQHIRQTPRVGDRYFIDYYQLTGELAESIYPLKMLKVVAVDKLKQSVQVQAGTWSYKTLWKMTNDFFNRKDGFNSNFHQQTITLPMTLLQKHDLVLQARRRLVNIDMEKNQRFTQDDVRILEYPR